MKRLSFKILSNISSVLWKENSSKTTNLSYKKKIFELIVLAYNSNIDGSILPFFHDLPGRIA